jgi:hypothetical protein
LPIFSKVEPQKIARSAVSVQSPNTPEMQKSDSKDHTPRSTIRRVSGRNAFATPSISGALRVDAPPQVEEPSEIRDKSSSAPAKKDHPFSQEELVRVWKKFVEKIDAPQLKSALSIKEPGLKDLWIVEYELDNELQLQRLTLDLKPKLLGYLRQHLKNELIDISFTVSAHTETGSSIPYTESEKWQMLVEKYPALASLKSKFGLDFE